MVAVWGTKPKRWLFIKQLLLDRFYGSRLITHPYVPWQGYGVFIHPVAFASRIDDEAGHDFSVPVGFAKGSKASPIMQGGTAKKCAVREPNRHINVSVIFVS